MTTASEESYSLPFPPVVLGIAGCSGSGKTTLAQELARNLNGTHFHIDNYYRDLSHLPLEERRQQNFDHPELLESDLLVAHITELAAGRSVNRPLYDFAKHTRILGETEHISPGRVLLVDGIFALYYADLLPLYSLRVYVDATDAVCFERRLARDIRERGRTAENVRKHYDTTVRPMAEKYVRPSVVHADLVVDGTSALDWSMEQILSRLRTLNLHLSNKTSEI